jgi:glycerol-3-phosphate dehydrogenase
MVVVGGGATGVGVAVDATTRGYDVLLLEASDFGKGTSSRSTKLVHGGVRYLEQGNVSLVMEALKERGLLRQNAPHLVHDLAFIVPNYSWWEAPFYGIGLRLYDLLAGKYGFGRSKNLTREEVLERLPNLRTEGLRGGVVYFDGQFDDARLLIHLARTAWDNGATLVNYFPVRELTRNADGYVDGVVADDLESGTEFHIRGKVVINATGAFSDSVRRMADPIAEPMIAPSQGIHLVFDGSFLSGEDAILVPRTADGRVMFAIPWHGHTLVGTTDTPVSEAVLEPVPLEEEIDFVLYTAALYLDKAPSRTDILSMWAGVRPLVKASHAGNTAALSRDHTIHIDTTALVTVTGGKWTTYRRMAEDCVDQAATIAQLDDRPCLTRQLRVHGYSETATGPLSPHGYDARDIESLDSTRLHPALPHIAGEVIWGVRYEMARTVDDVLSRRIRALPLNARAAMEMAGPAAALMAGELGRDFQWQEAQVEQFKSRAAAYVPHD